MIGTKSYIARAEQQARKWYLIDAEGKSLGRLSVVVARILSGKHKPTYTPHVDTGDFVVIVNASKLAITPKKLIQSTVVHHTGHPGGLKTETYKEVMEKNPARLIERVVRGMLPKTKLGRAMFTKLKVYSGAEHPHAAQNPEKLD